MANVRIATNTRNAMLDALAARVDLASGSPNAGRIDIYDGSQPANSNVAVTTQVRLAVLTFADPAAAAASAGVLTFNTITEDTSADATGTAAWARIVDGDGNAVFDCDVGTSATTIVLNTTSIVAAGPVRITSFTLTFPAT